MNPATLPLWKRPGDLALAAFFSISVVYGLLVSLPEGLVFRSRRRVPGPRCAHSMAGR